MNYNLLFRRAICIAGGMITRFLGYTLDYGKPLPDDTKDNNNKKKKKKKKKNK